MVIEKMFNKIYRIGIVLFVITFVFGSISMVALLLGGYEISYYGFAVDSEDNLYIGFANGEIKKIKDNQVVKTYWVGTNRGYDFTIVDDVIVVWTNEKPSFMDLDGEKISVPDLDNKRYHELRPDKNRVENSSGVLYEQKFNWGRTRIVKYSDDKEDIVYEMSVDDYIVRLGCRVFYPIGLSTIVLFIIYNFRIKVKRNDVDLSRVPPPKANN